MLSHGILLERRRKCSMNMHVSCSFFEIPTSQGIKERTLVLSMKIPSHTPYSGLKGMKEETSSTCESVASRHDAQCINRFIRYEIQSGETARRLGLGRALMHNLDSIGQAFGMSLILLTHLKSTFWFSLILHHNIEDNHADNKPARAFYDSLG